MLGGFGCSQSTMTNPSRAATEQLLLSTAADRAIKTMSFTALENKRVYVDGTFLDSYDSKYVLGTVREAVSHAGGLLQSDLSKSDVVLEVRSGALSIDAGDSLIGIPQMGVPMPMAGAISTPELALYKSSRQNALGKFAILAYATDTREYLQSTTSNVGKAYNHYYKLLGIITWTRTDIPEKHKAKKVSSTNPP